jgi:hypothetical protein
MRINSAWSTALIRLRLFRVQQWHKQFLVVMPVIALGNDLDLSGFTRVILAAFGFSLISSAVYIFNDICDLIADQNDSIKSSRPYASGVITKREAQIWIVLLIVLGLLLVFVCQTTKNDERVVILLSFYLVINFIYSYFRIKESKITGLFFVSSGFGIRFTIGTLVLALPPSLWAILLITQLTLFMLAGKRCQKAVRSGFNDSNDQYFWLITMSLFAAFFSATYVAFSLDANVQNTWGVSFPLFSMLPIMFGMLRYVELTYFEKSHKKMDITQQMIFDPFLILAVITYCLLMFIGRSNVG